MRSLLTLNTREEINNSLKDLKNTNNNISYVLEGNNEKYIIIHALNSATFALDGEYEVVLSNVEMTSDTYSTSIQLKNNQSIILKRK